MHSSTEPNSEQQRDVEDTKGHRSFLDSVGDPVMLGSELEDERDMSSGLVTRTSDERSD